MLSSIYFVQSANMSYIWYRFISEKDFLVYPCDKLGCTVGDFQQFLTHLSKKPSSRRFRYKSVYSIKDASTNEGMSVFIIFVSSHRRSLSI